MGAARNTSQFRWRPRRLEPSRVLSRHDRLLRLGRAVQKCPLKLTDEQICMMDRLGPKFRERHIETRHADDHVAA